MVSEREVLFKCVGVSRKPKTIESVSEQSGKCRYRDNNLLRLIYQSLNMISFCKSSENIDFQG